MVSITWERFMKPNTVLYLILFTAAAVAQPQAAQDRSGQQTPQVVSPEVLSDRRIIFRIYAPDAISVRLSGTDFPALAPPPGRARGTPLPPGPELKKDERGLWEGTLGEINPGAYRYLFVVNGVQVVDPRNPVISESNNSVWSMVYVPGADFMDTKDVPHGAVAAIHYYSAPLKRWRRMHIYTPPGYEAGGSTKYPVFYLLHGAGDCDEAWTSVGRAGFILDNLIAAKKAKPMIVVMPAGHVSAASSALPGSATPGAAAPRDEFQDDFLNAIMPYVEKNYRALHDPGNRAIAGLSMGGVQSLNAAFTQLEKFAYIGVFSSGGVLSLSSQGGSSGQDWEKKYTAMLDNVALKKGLKLVWLSTGSDDFLIATTKSTVEMLKKHGFDVTFKESAGGHTWINWRNYLNEFAPLLFTR
jgi:enterochelin esterase-like enzyme